MAQYWCNHCFKLVDLVNHKYKPCPFCSANSYDLFPVKKCNIIVPGGAKHGDIIEPYPED